RMPQPLGTRAGARRGTWAMVRAVTRRVGGSWWPVVTKPMRGLGWSLASVLVAGCTLAQRPSVKVVDPALMAEGTALERSRLPRGAGRGFGLGPYVVREVAVRSEAPDSEGPLAQEDVQRPVTQHRARAVLEAPQTQRRWAATCVLQRRAPAQADFRAVLDENGDEVAVECTAAPGGTRGQPPWRFEVRALGRT